MFMFDIGTKDYKHKIWADKSRIAVMSSYLT